MNPSNLELDSHRRRVTARQQVTVVCVVLGLLLLVSFGAEAQQPTKPYRIGWLSVAVGPTARTQSFIDGLRDLGYVEGKDFLMEYRRSAGNLDRLPELAADLVRVKVDVIVAAGTLPARSAKRATGTIPIVFAAADSPVERGLVTSLARPGANVTGITLQVPMAKDLQILTDIAPGTSRVAYFYTTVDEYTSTSLAGLEADGRTLNVKLDLVHVREPADVERAFSEFTRHGTNGLLIDSTSVLLRIRERVCRLALKQRLPVVGRGREFADAGCLASYAENMDEVFRRAATYVDRILKGMKPADLPVEQPTKFEFVINMKTARALRMTIPSSVLLRADQLVE